MSGLCVPAEGAGPFPGAVIPTLSEAKGRDLAYARPSADVRAECSS